MRIELVIDELRLHGVDARHRHAVADSVQREAAALVAAHLQRLTGATSGTADVVDGGAFDPGADAASAGRAIARAVVDSVLAHAGSPLSPAAAAPAPTAPVAAPEGRR